MKSQINLGTPEYDQIERVNQVNQPLVQALNSGPHNSESIRLALEKITGHQIDETNEIHIPFYTDFGRNIHIGKSVYINVGGTFVDLGGIYIDDHVLIGPNVTIASVNHRLASTDRRNLDLNPVHICDNAWLGANVTVTPGVKIGENSVVAAGAVVTHDVPANTVVAGVPAKPIKKIER